MSTPSPPSRLPRPPAPTPSSCAGIGLWGATLLVIGNVIGSGIFLTTGGMVAELPSTTLVLAAWVAGGLLAMAGGLTYAEMGSMYPRSGGLYVYLSEAYGPAWGFLFGWACLLVILTGSVATVAVGFAEYFSYFFPALGTDRVLVDASRCRGAPWSISAGQLVAAGSIAIITAINYVGVQQRQRSPTACSRWPRWGAGGAADAGPGLPARRAGRSRRSCRPDALRPLASFGVMMIAVMWTYEGWYYVAFAAGEIKDAARNVPRALIYGTLALTAIYVAVNLGLRLHAVARGDVGRDAHRREGGDRAGRPGRRGAGGRHASWSRPSAATWPASSRSSRTCFAMAADGRFFPPAARVHPVYRTPHVAILITSVWSAFLTLTGGYETLFTYVTFASVLFGTLGGMAIFVLRARRPDVPRPVPRARLPGDSRPLRARARSRSCGTR